MPMFGGSVGSDLEEPAPTTVPTTVDLEEASPTPEVQPIEAPAIAPEVKKPASKAKPKKAINVEEERRSRCFMAEVHPTGRQE